MPGEKQPVGIGDCLVEALTQVNDELVFERKADGGLPPPEQGMDDDNEDINAKDGNQA